jgi:hypothetical protein
MRCASTCAAKRRPGTFGPMTDDFPRGTLGRLATSLVVVGGGAYDDRPAHHSCALPTGRCRIDAAKLTRMRGQALRN